MRPDSVARRWTGAVGTGALLAWLAVLPGPIAAQDAPDLRTESYRDWTLTCRAAGTTDTQPPRCEIAQELEAETGQRLLRMALEVSDPAGAAVTLVTPFGVRVMDGVGISSEGTDLARIDFLTCLSGGCVATGVLDAATVSAMSAGNSATVSMSSTTGDEVQVKLSLSGFGAAWRRLTALSPK